MTTTIYRTTTGYTYAITTGMPEQPVRVGEGETIKAALEDRTATGVQSAGTWPRERDLSVIASACAENADALAEDVGDGKGLIDALAEEVDIDDMREFGRAAAEHGDLRGYGLAMIAAFGTTIIDDLPQHLSDAWFEALESGATPESAERDVRRMIAEPRAEVLG